MLATGGPVESNRVLLALLLVVVVAAVRPCRATLTCEDRRGQSGAFRMLQPDDMNLILHGAGQDSASFQEYWEFMPPATKPVVMMSYTSLNMTQEVGLFCCARCESQRV